MGKDTRDVDLLKTKRTYLILFCLIFTFGLDQVTKSMAKAALFHFPPILYLGGLVRLQYAENSGAFLSLGAHLSEELRFWIFSVSVALFLGVVTTYLFRTKSTVIASIGLSLTVAGGIGNLVDRLRFGRVVDFMNVGIGGLRTGIFNVADMAIMVGVGLFFFDSIFRQSEKAIKPQS